ncbi:hypothetical protein [Microbispora sp. NPDC049125]|uniref:hypothetical protein n=1 Tax=Microbispora sp. NPDC049125 TaxID=3154929 RepID=UPI003466A48F
MSRWVGVGGWEVDAVVLGGRQLLRVRHLGYHIANCRTVREVAAHVDLADLVEVVQLAPAFLGTGRTHYRLRQLRGPGPT